MKKNNQPQLIVLTPVRNEAWVLRAFLTATSLWADKIIIADQMSTDGSREIYKEFPKVIVLDNDRPQMHQAATRRMLFDYARKMLNGDTNAILFALDADEFLSGDFLQSNDWEKIINSEPDDAFCWRWMNLKESDPTKYSDFQHYYWAGHVSDTIWDGMFPDNFIHEWRLPWPPACDEKKSFDLDELRSIHFARVNTLRQANKERFYAVSSRAATNKDSHSNIVYNSRMYQPKKLKYFDVPKDAYCTYLKNDIDIWALTDLSDEGAYYTQEVLKFFQQFGTRRFAWLDIWDEGWCKRNGVENPQKWYHRWYVSYIRISAPYSKTFFIRAIDKVLKKILK